LQTQNSSLEDCPDAERIAAIPLLQCTLQWDQNNILRSSESGLYSLLSESRCERVHVD
jgi:hypothetical protein